jgi:predicted enzyme related to lactoylglutathione lyase
MDMKLELILLPANDLDESKKFYADTLGFHLDHDVSPGNGIRVIQLTPPGSACSIAIGSGMGTEDAAPIKNIHLVVKDIVAVRESLVARGLEVGEIDDMGGVLYAYFSDPTGNSFALQQVGY